jgi:hypothetical protein
VRAARSLEEAGYDVRTLLDDPGAATAAAAAVES